MNAATWIRAALRGSEEALRDDALSAAARGEAAALVVLVSRMLVARRFASPRDRRIESFAVGLVAMPPLDELFTAVEIEAAVRAALGDVDQLGKVRADHMVAVNLLLARVLLAEGNYSPGQVDQLIAYAESQVRALPDLPDPTPVNRPQRRRIRALIGRSVLVGAAIALVAGYLVAGFVTPGFLADSSASQSRSYPADVETYVTDLAQSIETRDGVAFQALLCTDADPVESYIQQLGDVHSVVIDTVTGEGDNYTVLFEISGDGETAPAAWLGHLRKEEGQWCLSNFASLDQP